MSISILKNKYFSLKRLDCHICGFTSIQPLSSGIESELIVWHAFELTIKVADF